MLKLTCDTEIMKSITEGEQDYTNNKAAIQELIDAGYSNAFLGGQDHLSLLTAAADNIDLTNKLSAYDQGCNEQFQSAMKDYFLGNVTYDEALENFKTNITTVYNTLSMD
jgi:phospholipase/lecithinase/hemolysin